MQQDRFVPSDSKVVLSRSNKVPSPKDLRRILWLFAPVALVFCLTPSVVRSANPCVERLTYTPGTAVPTVRGETWAGRIEINRTQGPRVPKLNNAGNDARVVEQTCFAQGTSNVMSLRLAKSP